MARLPAPLRRSLTWDQGKELALHAEIAQALACRCSSARRTHPGSGRVTRTLLRQNFPKGSDLRVHSPQQLAAVAGELNERPRKVLDWDSPAVRLAAYLPGRPRQASLPAYPGQHARADPRRQPRRRRGR
jgi:IS30 family transposase